jgi:hypothetical protein
MTILRVCAALVIGASFASAAPAPAAPAAAAPAPAAPAAAKVTALVKIVDGTVETRPAVGQPWVPVKAGTALEEGADLRTGFRARCVLDMTESLVQVGPLTVVRLGELRRDGDKIRTRVLMKQGTARAEVVKKTVASDFAIVTPSATLSVRGTNGIQCSFFPDLGGQYGLTQSGLIQITEALLGRRTGVRPGEETDDWATLAASLEAIKHQPQVLDPFGFTADEKWAAMRWDTSTPMPIGLNGPGASPFLKVLRSKLSSYAYSVNPDGNGEYYPPNGGK